MTSRAKYDMQSTFQKPIVKSAIGFVWGIIMGVGIYFLLLSDMEFSPRFTLSVAGIMTTCLAFGNAFSIYVRCISLLTVTCFWGKTGRGLLKGLALTYVLTGPLANIATNTKEVVRVFGCTAELTYNLTKTRYDLMIKPFQDALLGMRHNPEEINEILTDVDGIIQPIITEVEGEEETNKYRAETDYIDAVEENPLRSTNIENKYNVKNIKRSAENDSLNEDEMSNVYEMKYRKKSEYRCEEVINKGTSKCRAMFQGAYDSCYEKVSFMAAWLLCWPMKLTFMCNLVSVFGGDKICDSSSVIQPGFGKSYSTTKESENILKENFGDVKINYAFKGSLPKVDVKTAAEAAHATLQQFSSAKTIVDSFILLTNRLLAIAFIIVIFNAVQYQEKYLNDIEFDNIYITKYFREIDLRRKMRGQKHLFPLKKTERKYLLEPRALLPTKAERLRMIKLTLILILETIPASTFFVLDFALTELLDLIAEHAHVEFTQKGHQDLSINVTGTGFVSNIVRSLVDRFNIKQRVHVVHSNVKCLPRANDLSDYFALKVYGFYTLVWILIIADGYTIRLNHMICGYFYKKRAKRRTLYKYNETLARRIRYYRNLLSIVHQRAKEMNLALQFNIFLSARLLRPKKFSWLKKFPCGKQSCLICEEGENATFYCCPSPDCFAVYCQECWKDVNKVCYKCTDLGDEEDSF